MNIFEAILILVAAELLFVGVWGCSLVYPRQTRAFLWKLTPEYFQKRAVKKSIEKAKQAGRRRV